MERKPSGVGALFYMAVSVFEFSRLPVPFCIEHYSWDNRVSASVACAKVLRRRHEHGKGIAIDGIADSAFASPQFRKFVCAHGLATCGVPINMTLSVKSRSSSIHDGLTHGLKKNHYRYVTRGGLLFLF